MDLSHICKIMGHFLFQKKVQLGHPDEIRAKKDFIGQADEHGLKKKVYFAFGVKGHIASRHLCMPGRDSAARRFVLICVYRARSRLAWQTGASEAGGSVQICLPRLISKNSAADLTRVSNN